MSTFSIVTLILSSILVGFIMGRTVTKTECGKMLRWLEESGYLNIPVEDIDDDEDFK